MTRYGRLEVPVVGTTIYIRDFTYSYQVSIANHLRQRVTDLEEQNHAFGIENDSLREIVEQLEGLVQNLTDERDELRQEVMQYVAREYELEQEVEQLEDRLNRVSDVVRGL